ncbi:MAG: hypothetical protein R3C44_02255 [Chloroflexota bacterium]
MSKLRLKPQGLGGLKKQVGGGPKAVYHWAMTQPTTAPYGAWKSPISLDLMLAGTVSLAHVMVDGDAVYWIEGRPMEGGRNVIVRRTAEGRLKDLTPAPYNARTRVHEYGGGQAMVHDGVVYFPPTLRPRLPQQPDGEPEALDAGGQAALRRHGDGQCPRPPRLCSGRSPADRPGGDQYAGGCPAGRWTAAGAGRRPGDFYATPRLSPDGRQLAWLSWDHPNMPWDGNELWLADIDSTGVLTNRRLVAGGPEESIFQLEWSPDGVLYFTSDRTGWWNLYRLQDGQVEAIYLMEAEFGMPQFVPAPADIWIRLAERNRFSIPRMARRRWPG